jgi:hypothetical protein
MTSQLFADVASVGRVGVRRKCYGRWMARPLHLAAVSRHLNGRNLGMDEPGRVPLPEDSVPWANPRSPVPITGRILSFPEWPGGWRGLALVCGRSVMARVTAAQGASAPLQAGGR